MGDSPGSLREPFEATERLECRDSFTTAARHRSCGPVESLSQASRRDVVKKFVTLLLALALACGSALVCSAQEMRQIVTVSAAGYDALTKTVGTIGRL
jgi:hypothetical protein